MNICMLPLMQLISKIGTSLLLWYSSLVDKMEPVTMCGLLSDEQEADFLAGHEPSLRAKSPSQTASETLCCWLEGNTLHLCICNNLTITHNIYYYYTLSGY